MTDTHSGEIERFVEHPDPDRFFMQIEEDDEMFWKSVGVVGTMQGQTVVLQQLVVLRNGNVLPLDAHRTIGTSV